MWHLQKALAKIYFSKLMRIREIFKIHQSYIAFATIFTVTIDADPHLPEKYFTCSFFFTICKKTVEDTR